MKGFGYILLGFAILFGISAGAFSFGGLLWGLGFVGFIGLFYLITNSDWANGIKKKKVVADPEQEAAEKNELIEVIDIFVSDWESFDQFEEAFRGKSSTFQFSSSQAVPNWLYEKLNSKNETANQRLRRLWEAWKRYNQLRINLGDEYVDNILKAKRAEAKSDLIEELGSG